MITVGCEQGPGLACCGQPYEGTGLAQRGQRAASSGDKAQSGRRPHALLDDGEPPAHSEQKGAASQATTSRAMAALHTRPHTSSRAWLG